MKDFREHLETVKEDCYKYNQSYFFFRKPNGSIFVVTDASGQFGNLGTIDQETDNNRLYSIQKKCDHYDENGFYDPIEKICDMVKDFEPFHYDRDERILIDNPYGYSRKIPTFEWEYVLNKAN
jgi:hypothetical protein